MLKNKLLKDEDEDEDAWRRLRVLASMQGVKICTMIQILVDAELEKLKL